MNNRCPYCGTYLYRQNNRVWSWGGHPGWGGGQGGWGHPGWGGGHGSWGGH